MLEMKEDAGKSRGWRDNESRPKTFQLLALIAIFLVVTFLAMSFYMFNSKTVFWSPSHPRTEDSIQLQLEILKLRLEGLERQLEVNDASKVEKIVIKPAESSELIPATSANSLRKVKRSRRAALPYYSINPLARKNGGKFGNGADIQGPNSALGEVCQCEPGPEGRLGETGPKGDTGSPGFPGERGEPGLNGVPGNDGSPGATGTPGAPGSQGMKGMTGDVGQPGDSGRYGQPGPSGPQGPPGRDGVDGLDGKNGESGVDGTPGKDGQEGKPGLDGRPGRDGVPGDRGADGTLGSPGTPGEKGMTGPEGPAGPTGPQGAPGNDGLPGPPGAVTETLVKGEPGQDGAPGSPGQSGNDGLPGAPGSPGEQGPQGLSGSPGVTGSDGSPGARGLPGIDGTPGEDGARGPMGPPGVTGTPGEKGQDGVCTQDCSDLTKTLMRTETRGMKGIVYTRWGSLTCTNPDEELVYYGHMASGHYHYTGSGGNYMCMPDTPKFDKIKDGFDSDSIIFGARYKVADEVNVLDKSPKEVHDRNAACAVCYNPNQVVQSMFPALSMCPNNFNSLYQGYLMSTDEKYARTEYVCVDKKVDVYPGGGNETDATGSVLYVVEAHCGGLNCNLYPNGREINCIVCGR